MKKIVLKNKFHNTEVTVSVPNEVAAAGAADTWFFLQEQVHGVGRPTEAAKARIRRVRNALCGRRDCTCGVVR